MLSWFPTPYPDELLYSVFARYHVRSGNISPKMTIEELFGNRSTRAVWDLPANINDLVIQLGAYWEADQFIYNHTMYPYYATFLLPTQTKQVKKSMEDNKGSTIHTRIGISAGNIKSKTNLFMCDTCIKEDMDTYGETYWHRVHQAPGVIICPNHNTVLKESVISLKLVNQHEFVIATPFIERKRFCIDNFTDDEMKLLFEVAKITEASLSIKKLQSIDSCIRGKYLAILKDKGLASPNGFLRRKRLYQEFNTIFSKSLLELLQSSTPFEKSNWLTMIFQKHRKSFHPIRHILIILFLGIDLDYLLEAKEYRFFGKGPWLCLNVACPNHKKPVVKSLIITRDYKTGKPVGTFQCDCGFIFSRRGPDADSKDKYRIGTIKDYGWVWKGKLTELVNEGQSLTKIGSELEADRATIKKYATELDLKVSWKPPATRKRKENIVVKNYEEQLKERKDKWIKLQNLYPDKSKTVLRKIVPDVYTFLYRHDINWLNQNSPISIRKRTSYQRIDWKKRDEQLRKEIKKIINEWDSNCERLTRITVSSIGKKINKLWLLQKMAYKLPKTMEFINQVSEDVVSFQKRRVKFVIKKLQREGKPIVEWRIYREAGLRSTVSNEVKRFISLKIN